MYSIRPHSSNNVELDLPNSMYTVQTIMPANNQTTDKEVELNDIEQQQDVLLGKLEQLWNQLVLYQTTVSKATREELVVHLSVTRPSKGILDLIELFRDKLSIRTYRHSSSSTMPHIPSSNNGNADRTLTIIWAEGDNLPCMVHSHSITTDEQSIVNVLSQQFTDGQ